jgi:predicted ribosome quality control (RQC) complex YloA/Tae2 family protein
MGKHSNIILLNKEGTIIDSIRHTFSDANSYRDIFPGKKYIFPTSNKKNFLEIASFDEFLNTLKNSFEVNAMLSTGSTINTSEYSFSKILTNTFTGFSSSFSEYVAKKFNANFDDVNSIKASYEYICALINSIDANNLAFIKTENEKDYILQNSNLAFEKNENEKNYILQLDEKKESSLPFALNFFIDDFYTAKENFDEFTNSKNTILKKILEQSKKYNKRLENINEKLSECNEMETYRLYGELITANLYKLKETHTDSIELENYYNNNKTIIIPLEKRFSPAINAKRYFKKYSKLKNALAIVSTQKEETIQELNYIESIIYEIENASSILDIQEIYEEISENIVFKEKFKKKAKTNKASKKNNLKKNTAFNFSPITYNVVNHTFLVGRNNKENDYLTLKFANKNDIWFHTKDIHGSHAILKVETNEQIDDDILVKCAKITVRHSKAKSSSNVPVDYCLVKYVKKPAGSKPGMVIYTNNKTIYVTP